MPYRDKQDRAEAARRHHGQMAGKHADEIRRCVAGTRIFGPGDWPEGVRGPGPKVTLLKTDTVSALFGVNGPGIVVHNFASFTRPGGGFLTGAMAQEEALCAESALCNVLQKLEGDFYEWNRKHQANGLYEDRIALTPSVPFEHGPFIRKADVLTCAAPNLARASVSPAENTLALESRVDKIFAVLEASNAKTFITGAWGCGVFKQDPAQVAGLMLDRAATSSLTNLVFAIPGGRNGNYDAFRRICAERGVI